MYSVIRWASLFAICRRGCSCTSSGSTTMNTHLKLKDTETLYLSFKEIQRTHSYKSTEENRKGTTETRTLRACTDYICPRLNPRTNIVVLLATSALCLFHRKPGRYHFPPLIRIPMSTPLEQILLEVGKLSPAALMTVDHRTTPHQGRE
jgi:hypothetical protein